MLCHMLCVSTSDYTICYRLVDVITALLTGTAAPLTILIWAVAAVEGKGELKTIEMKIADLKIPCRNSYLWIILILTIIF